MISPIGTFLTRMDAALTGSMDGIIASMTSAMATPIALAAVIYYGVQGLRLANGDPAPLQGFVPQLIRIGTVIWLSSNLSAFNQWVRDIFFTGLPNALGAAITSSTGVANSLTSTAATFDGIWNQIWVIVGMVWTMVGLSVTGVVAALVGIMTVMVGGLGLIVMALIYLGARMVLAVIICLAPVIIGCALFDATKPIFERAVGKAIALIVLQAAGFIVMQIMLTGDQWFLAQATTAILATVSNSAAFAQALQILGAMMVWFMAGAFAMWSLPAIAYSIGSGVALSGRGLVGFALLARAMGGGGGNGSQAAATSTAEPPRPLGVAFARPELSGGSTPSLPAPVPPSISSSTRR